MAQLLLANPKKRRRSTKRRSTTRSLARRRSYRRNPIKAKGLVNTFQKGAVGGAGALMVDVAMQRLPLPEGMTTGTFAPVVKGMVGVGLGMIVSNFMRNKQLGVQLADGAVTVAMYNFGKELIGPTLGLSESDLLGYYSDMDLGYLNPAEIVDSSPSYDFDMEDSYDYDDFS